MLIANKNFDVKSLSSIILEPDKVVSVVEASVPVYLRHHRDIVMNQRFYVANLLRGAGAFPLNVKMPVCEALVEGISVTGTTEIFTSIEDVKNEIDMELLEQLLKGDDNDDIRNFQKGCGVHLTQNVSV